MTQAERDRLVALKKAKKKLITQKQAAEELGITERHVRRLLRELKRRYLFTASDLACLGKPVGRGQRLAL
jgi:predicted ArsR family transcriptional regulator